MTISVAASEKKRPRGRPRVMHEEWSKELARVWPRIKTTRGLQNRGYAHTALSVLSLLPALKPGQESLGWVVTPPQGYESLRWLVDWDGAEQNKIGAIKWSILTELGRLSEVCGDEFTLRLADVICTRKPSTKVGAAIVRRARLRALGREQPAASQALLARLAGVVDEYRGENPTISAGTVLDVINELYWIVQNLAEGHG